MPEEGMEEPINEGKGQESESRSQANSELALRVKLENINGPCGQGDSAMSSSHPAPHVGTLRSKLWVTRVSVFGRTRNVRF